MSVRRAEIEGFQTVPIKDSARPTLHSELLPGIRAAVSSSATTSAAQFQELYKQAQRFDNEILHLKRILSPEHTLTKELLSIAREAATLLGLEPDKLKLAVYAEYYQVSLEQSLLDHFAGDLMKYVPTAFVNPLTSHIFINDHLVNQLKGDREMISAVIYHEVAHLIFEQERLADANINWLDPILRRNRTYEIEYHCDRVASQISSLRGEDPRAIGRALKFMDAYCKDLAAKAVAEGEDAFEVALVQSHPNLSRRCRANNALARRIGRTSSAHLIPLPAISDKEFIITRPSSAWGLISLPNIFGRVSNFPSFADQLTAGVSVYSPASAPKSRSDYKNILSDYRGLTGRRREGRDSMIYKEMPEPVCELFSSDGQPKSIEHVSDWFREVLIFLQEGNPVYVGDLYDEIAECSKEQVVALMNSIDLARVVENHNVPREYWELTGSFVADVAISILANRYLELRLREGASEFDVFKEFLSMADEAIERFTWSPLAVTPELIEIAARVIQAGNQAAIDELIALVHKTHFLNTWLAPAPDLKGGDPGVLLNQQAFSEDCVPHKVRVVRDAVRADRAKKANQESLIKRLEEMTNSVDSSRVVSKLEPSGSPHELLALAIAKTFRTVEFRETATPRLSEIPLATLLSSLPFIIRRISGARVSVTDLNQISSQARILLTVGDQPLTDPDTLIVLEMLRHCLSSRNMFSGPDGQNAPEVVNALATQLLPFVEETVRELQQAPSYSIEERTQFLHHQLPALIKHETGDLGTSLGRHIDLVLPGTPLYGVLNPSVDDRILCLGTQEAAEDLVGTGRDQFTATNYRAYEARELRYFQYGFLWEDTAGEAFRQMSPGYDKLLFVVSGFPLKSNQRDVLMCEALGYPPLNYLDDVGQLQVKIASESDLGVLLALRDNFNSHLVAQLCEAQLHKLFSEQQSSFLENPSIKASHAGALARLPLIVQEHAANNQELLGILLSFVASSRERDRLLRPWIDAANSAKLRRGLATLLVDPVLSGAESSDRMQGRAGIETLIDFVGRLHPYEKAQALLFFMGQRQFPSAIAHFFHSSKGYSKSKNEFQREEDFYKTLPLLSNRDSGPSFRKPDVMIRAQKALGMSFETAEQLEGGLLNEDALSEMLGVAIFGASGINSDKKIKHNFFKAAGRTIIADSPSCQDLSSERRKELANFLAFALAECPQDKLPIVLLKLWDATRQEGRDMAKEASTLLENLGPAFVKLGQRLRTSPDISPEFREAFRRLSSKNTTYDSTVFEHNTEVMYKKVPFDHSRSGKKLGEGSMAAAFFATLKDTQEEVVVKMIHPFILDELEQDKQYIRKLVEYINEHKPFGQLTLPSNTPEVIEAHLRSQIDTGREIGNAELLRAALTKKVDNLHFIVPEVLPKLCVSGAIVSQYIPSYELDDEQLAEQGVDRQRIQNSVAMEVLRQILFERAYQADVNLGNFGVQKDQATGKVVLRDRAPVLAWFDAGAVESISTNDQITLLSIVKAIAVDHRTPTDHISSLIKGSTNEESRERIAAVCTEWAARLSDSQATIGLTNIRGALDSLVEAVSQAGLEIEERWLTLANTLSMLGPLLEGVESDRIVNLVKEAMQHHNMLTVAEKFLVGIKSLFKRRST